MLILESRGDKNPAPRFAVLRNSVRFLARRAWLSLVGCRFNHSGHGNLRRRPCPKCRQASGFPADQLANADAVRVQESFRLGACPPKDVDVIVCVTNTRASLPREGAPKRCDLVAPNEAQYECVQGSFEVEKAAKALPCTCTRPWRWRPTRNAKNGRGQGGFASEEHVGCQAKGCPVGNVHRELYRMSELPTLEIPMRVLKELGRSVDELVVGRWRSRVRSISEALVLILLPIQEFHK